MAVGWDEYMLKETTSVCPTCLTSCAAQIIERDGKEIARLPEQPSRSSGTPIWQGLTSGDTPVRREPGFHYRDPAGEFPAHRYGIRAVNAAGLASEVVPGR